LQQQTTGAPPPASPPPTPPAPRAAGVTVRDVIRSFLDDAAVRVADETLRLYRFYLDGFARQHGRLAAAALTCPLAGSYSRRPSWGASTRAVFLATLARAFSFAERARLIDRTPLVGLRKPTVASRAADVLVSTEQHAALLAASPPYFRSFL